MILTKSLVTDSGQDNLQVTLKSYLWYSFILQEGLDLEHEHYIKQLSRNSARVKPFNVGKHAQFTTHIPSHNPRHSHMSPSAQAAALWI